MALVYNWFLDSECDFRLVVHADGDVGAGGLLLDPLWPRANDFRREVVHPIADGALPDEAAVALLLGVVGGHVDAGVVAEGVNVKVSFKLWDLESRIRII